MDGDRISDTQTTEGSTTMFIPRCSIGCFFQNGEAAELMRELSNRTVLMRTDIAVHEGGLEKAIRHYPIGQTPEILIIEFDDALDQLDRLAEMCATTTNVILVGHRNDVRLYRDVTAKGVADYLTLPLTARDLLTTISNVSQSELGENHARIITFMGASGGSGSSTLAQCCAVALGQAGKSTLLLDLDFYMGSTSVNFDLNPSRNISDFFEVGKTVSRSQVEQMVCDRGEKLSIICQHPVIRQEATVPSDSIMGVVEHARLMADFLVIDLPTAWGSVHPHLLATSDDVMITANPTLTSLQNTRNLLTQSADSRVGLRSSRVILNKVVDASRKSIGVSVFEKLTVPDRIFEVGDFPKEMLTAAEQGKNVLELDKAEKFMAAYRPITEQFVGAPETANERKPNPFVRMLRRWKA